MRRAGACVYVNVSVNVSVCRFVPRICIVNVCLLVYYSIVYVTISEYLSVQQQAIKALQMKLNTTVFM